MIMRKVIEEAMEEAMVDLLDKAGSSTTPDYAMGYAKALLDLATAHVMLFED